MAPAPAGRGNVKERGRLARLVARLSGRWQLERLAEIEEKVGAFGRAQREDLAAQRQQLSEIAKAVALRATTEAVRGIDRRVGDLQVSLAQRDRALSEALERAHLFDEQGMDDRRFARRIEAIRRSGRPIVVGPWTGEVGFELLYWIPFVRWIVQTYDFPPERLLAVSRGGVSDWYGGLAASYADVFSFFSTDEFREATQVLKQREVGTFDAEVVKRVVAAHRLGAVDLLHPGMMYRLFMPFWKEIAPPSRVDRYTAYARLGAADDPIVRGLPAEYVAARFYFSDCFPDTPANRSFVSSTLETISRQMPVVLLNTPYAVDDHRDVGAHPDGVVTIGEHLAPERNLAVQTAVIARSRAFVGTYGGYSYLAPFCGVPALAFFSERTFKDYHLHVAARVFERLGGASLVPLEVANLPWVRLALSGIVVTAP
jgi:hypothetical protein